MMKKMLSMLMAMLLLWSFTVAAHAENEFVLRNGIQFGDTREEVRAKETLLIDYSNEDENKICTKKGNVAGFEEVAIVYEFDEKDKLIGVMWSLYSPNDNDYSKLKKAISEKYGTPLDNTNGDSYIITTLALSETFESISIYRKFGIEADIYDYDGWDYEYRNGQHAKIELVQYCLGYNYVIHVGYKHFTDEELDAAIQEKQEKDANEKANVLNDI